MTQMVGGKVQLDNGQLVTPQVGGWYGGMQYWNGTLSAPGSFNSQNNQPGQQGGLAPVQNQADASFLVGRGDTTAPQRVVGQTPIAAPGSSGAGVQTLTPMGQAPAFDLNAVTNAAYNTPEILAANKAITERQTALAAASAGIDDNPFYSEATRVGKQAQLTNRANADITVQENILSRLKSDAAIKVAAATGQYNINRQEYQDRLSLFKTVLDAGGLTNASPTDLASYAVATGIPYAQLQSIQKAQQDKDIKTQLVTSDNGTISIINTRTGEIVGQTQAGIGNAENGKSGGGASKPDTNKYLTPATKYLAEADIALTGKGSADKLLSRDEALQAYQRILALVGGNPETADAVFDQAMSAGGYNKYGNW